MERCARDQQGLRQRPQTAERLLALAVDDIDDLNEQADRHDLEVDDIPYPAGRDEYVIYQFRDRSGRVLLRSHDAPQGPFEVPLVRGFSESGGRRIYTEVTPNGNLFIQAGEKESHRRRALLRGLFSLTLPLLLMPVLAWLVIWTVVAQSFRPLRGLREQIAQRGGSNLEPLSDQGLPNELAPIVRDVNRLVERLGAALEAERSFAANSAHEMRTPVAAALAQVQRLGSELAGRPEHARIVQIENTLRRLAARVGKLLQLSRADSGVAITSESSDLLPILQLVIDEFARTPERSGQIRLEIERLERLPGRIDIDAFAIVLRNLVENALLHGKPGEAVRIWVEQDRSIHIVNAGPVIGAEVLQNLTQRFYRGRTSAEGSGLGLAIAERIVSQAGGRLELHSPAIGRADGFEAIVRLP
jgi:two-component system OmpR family sensor kinase